MVRLHIIIRTVAHYYSIDNRAVRNGIGKLSCALIQFFVHDATLTI